MKFKIKIDELNRVLATFKVIISDALDEQKNIIFWKSTAGLKIVARNNIVDCICSTTADIEASDNEMVNIKYKELEAVLNGFKSLSMTKATDISFNFNENNIDVSVFEEPVDAEADFADKMYRENKFKLSLVKAVPEAVKNEILSVSFETSGTPVNGTDIIKYFNALLPTTSNLREGVASRFNVVGDHVFTTPQSFVAIMKYDIIDFTDFLTTRSTAEFMKSFFEIEEQTNVHIDVVGNDAKMVRLTNSKACAFIKTQSSAKAFDIKDYLQIPTTGVAATKRYFADVLRRMKSDEAIRVIIKEDEIILKQPKAVVSVPVYNARMPEGVSELSFQTNTDILNNLIFSHFEAGEILFIYFKNLDTKWEITFTDDSQAIDGSHLWWTRTLFKKL